MDDAKRYMLTQLSKRNVKDNFPLFTCSNCKADLQKITNLNSSESEASKAAHNHDDWDPEWIEGNFTAISVCQNCSDKAYIVGTYGLEDYVYEDDDDGRPHWDYREVFTIKYMTPAIELLKVSDKCPEGVRDHIMSAAEVIFANPDLAANRLRASIESLLTEQKIPKTKLNKKKKRYQLTTHNRIELLTEKNSEVGMLLEAVKWIGNDGSHDSVLSFADVINGLEIYSLALSLLYDDSSAAIKKKAAIINKNKGVKKSPTPFK
jgi:Domain of unknown function (DUF4145)